MLLVVSEQHSPSISHTSFFCCTHSAAIFVKLYKICFAVYLPKKPDKNNFSLISFEKMPETHRSGTVNTVNSSVRLLEYLEHFQESKCIRFFIPSLFTEKGNLVPGHNIK